MAVDIASIQVKALQTKASNPSHFLVNCYLPSDHATPVTSKQAKCVWKESLQLWEMDAPLYFDNLAIGQQYDFSVSVIPADGGVGSTPQWSSETCGDTTAPNPGYANAVVLATARGCSINLNPTNLPNPNDIRFYDFYASETNSAPSVGTEPTFCCPPSGVSAFEIAADSDLVLHYIWVRAVDASGNMQAWQSLGSFCPLSNPDTRTYIPWLDSRFSYAGKADIWGDADSYQGQSIYIGNYGNQAVVMTGPYLSGADLTAGKCLVLFRMKATAADSNTTPRITLGVFKSSGSVNLGTLVLSKASFPSANVYKDFCIPVYFNPTDTSIEFKLFDYAGAGVVGIYLDWIRVVPVAVNSDSVDESADKKWRTSLHTQAAPTTYPLLAASNTTNSQITVQPFTMQAGSISMSCLSADYVISGLATSSQYFIYYRDANFAGGNITPVATQDPNDLKLYDDIFLIGVITTPPAQAGGGGTKEILKPSIADIDGSVYPDPSNAWDNNEATGCNVSGYWDVANEIGYGAFSLWRGVPAKTIGSPSSINLKIVSAAQGKTATYATLEYSLNAGSTWETAIFSVTTSRAKTTDTISIPTNQATQNIFVRATVDEPTQATRQAWLDVYEITIEVNP